MWRCQPSEILYLDPSDWQTCFSVDQAVWNFGVALEEALDQAAKNTKNDRQRERARNKVFAQWLPGVMADTTRYRDVAQEAPDGVTRRV
jgi:hypothetical protein